VDLVALRLAIAIDEGRLMRGTFKVMKDKPHEKKSNYTKTPILEVAIYYDILIYTVRGIWEPFQRRPNTRRK
jgi:hypothetical protein